MPDVFLGLILFVLLIFSLHRYRQYWTHRFLDNNEVNPFNGERFIAGHTDIIKRHGSAHCQTTVVCFPGFMENQHYFLELYANQDVEFIALNNAGYYSCLEGITNSALSIAENNPYEPGTIEYDGFLLGHVIEHLATHPNIIIHAHSRGGAVVLEAGRQHPILMAKVNIVLEAPVLPQAKLAPHLAHVMRIGGLYWLPLQMALLRKLPQLNRPTEHALGPMTPRKKELLKKSHLLPKQYQTFILNVRNIIDWQKKSGYELYDHFKSVCIVIPEKDYILCRHAMNNSALQRKHVQIKEIPGANHFVSVEQPDTMQRILGLSPQSAPWVSTILPVC